MALRIGRRRHPTVRCVTRARLVGAADMAKAGIRGGDKLEKVLAGIARKVAKSNSVKVGFLEGAKYPDGTNVAQVAFWNEYGTVRSPVRSFFRTMIAKKSPTWGDAVAKTLKATDYDSKAALGLIGEGVKDQLVESIVQFSEPANAPSTVAAKGFNKPLIDTGLMQRSVEYEVSE